VVIIIIIIIINLSTRLILMAHLDSPKCKGQCVQHRSWQAI